MVDPWDEDNRDKVTDLGHFQMSNRSRCKLSKNFDDDDVDKVLGVAGGVLLIWSFLTIFQ